MSTKNSDESSDNCYSHSKFFHRSLSPCSFERLRNEHNDYFYKPKRGPSTSKSNITITRPIKTFETVTKLVELLSKGNNYTKNEHVNEIKSTLFDQQKSSSNYSNLLSIDNKDLSSSNSSISTISVCNKPQIIKSLPSKQNSLITSCHIPTIGMNITMKNLHLVLLELYPQNVNYSIISFQRYFISLITNNEHKNWSISNIQLKTTIEQEANFRLFTLTLDEFDVVLKQLQLFLNQNSSIESSLILNIALTGEQTTEYERKISSYLYKINLNFDIIQSRAETYMIAIDFFIENNQDNEFLNIYQNRNFQTNHHFYPYLLIHIESTTTFFYIIYSSNKYSILTSNNLSYKTYLNLLKILQPGYDEQMTSSTSSSYPIRRPPPISFDLNHRNSLTSFTNIPQRYFPSDYTLSKTTNYIYRGWSNRKICSHDQNLTAYDAHTQTDDSFLQYSSLQSCLAMHRSLLSMFIMNISLIIKLLLKIYPSIHNCILVGEFFQLETQCSFDLITALETILNEEDLPNIYQLKRQSFISALGCVLPRVYFDVIQEQTILENDSNE